MKQALFALALVVPLMASADVILRPNPDANVRQRAIREAQQVRLNLLQLHSEADRVSDRAASNGNIVRARRFRDVAVRAQGLARDIQQDVIRSLRQGDRLNQVGNRLDRLMGDAADLGRSVQQIRSLPANINLIVIRVVQDLRQLRAIL